MVNYNSTQTEQIKELGAYLRQKRLEKSLTLEQVASSTFIRLPMLKAMEEGNVDQLPELIYVQGFLRRYGEVLNLDGQTLAHQISPNTTETQPEISPEFVAKNFTPDPTGEYLASPALRQEDQSHSESIKPNKPQKSLVIPDLILAKLKAYGLYVALMGGAIIGLFYLLSRPPLSQSTAQDNPSETELTTSKISEKSEKPHEKAAKTADSSPSAANKLISSDRPSPILEATPSTSNSSDSTQTQNNQKPPTVNPTTSPSPTPSENSPVAAAVQLEEDSWMQVKIDGKTEYEGILKKGEQQTWTANKKLTLRVGNAGAVKLSVNNQPGETLGNLGQVKEVTLTPDD